MDENSIQEDMVWGVDVQHTSKMVFLFLGVIKFTLKFQSMLSRILFNIIP